MFKPIDVFMLGTISKHQKGKLSDSLLQVVRDGAIKAPFTLVKEYKAAPFLQYMQNQN